MAIVTRIGLFCASCNQRVSSTGALRYLITRDNRVSCVDCWQIERGVIQGGPNRTVAAGVPGSWVAAERTAQVVERALPDVTAMPYAKRETSPVEWQVRMEHRDKPTALAFVDSEEEFRRERSVYEAWSTRIRESARAHIDGKATESASGQHVPSRRFSIQDARRVLVNVIQDTSMGATRSMRAYRSSVIRDAVLSTVLSLMNEHGVDTSSPYRAILAKEPSFAGKATLTVMKNSHQPVLVSLVKMKSNDTYENEFIYTVSDKATTWDRNGARLSDFRTKEHRIVYELICGDGYPDKDALFLYEGLRWLAANILVWDDISTAVPFGGVTTHKAVTDKLTAMAPSQE